MQPWNALLPIVVTELGIVIVTKLLQSRNALIPIFVTFSGIFIVTKLLHPQKVFWLIAVKLLLGSNVTEVNLVQPWNAPKLILVTELGIVIEAKLLHPWNAYELIVVTPAGIVIEVKLVQ